jgi:hypothetical protein
MIIHQYRQLVATLRSAALYDKLAFPGRHPLPEAVHTHATTNFWLISPLRHYTFLSFEK